MILNLFITLNTPLRQVAWWSDGMTKAQFEDRNVVLRQEDKDTSIRTILTKALAGQSAVTAWAHHNSGARAKAQAGQ